MAQGRRAGVELAATIRVTLRPHGLPHGAHLFLSLGRASVTVAAAAAAVGPPKRQSLRNLGEGKVVRLAEDRVAPVSQFEGRLALAAPLPQQLTQRDVVVLQVPLLYLVRTHRVVPAVHRGARRHAVALLLDHAAPHTTPPLSRRRLSLRHLSTTSALGALSLLCCVCPCCGRLQPLKSHSMKPHSWASAAEQTTDMRSVKIMMPTWSHALYVVPRRVSSWEHEEGWEGRWVGLGRSW